MGHASFLVKRLGVPGFCNLDVVNIWFYPSDGYEDELLIHNLELIFVES